MYDLRSLLDHDALREPLRAAIESGTAPPYLRSVKIKLTARCNLRCVMCRYGRGEVLPELTSERWLQLIEQLGTTGCRKVHFSGGEVLVRPDFEALAAHATQHGLKVTLTSNLTLLTRERARALLAAEVRSVSTSLDGASGKVHEAVRRIPGSFRRTLRAISWLTRGRGDGRGAPRVRINFVMMRDNFRDYPALLQLASDLGAVDVVPMPVDGSRDLRLSKRLVREYERDLAPQVAELRERLGFPLGERYTFPFGRGRGDSERAARGLYAQGYYEEAQCYAPWLHLFVAWDGLVYACCMTNGRITPLGDLRSMSVAEVWHGERFAAFRREMLAARLPSCHSCDMYLEENQLLARELGAPRSRPQGVVSTLDAVPVGEAVATSEAVERTRRQLPLVG